ncbi:unnamed protein product [Symbiodinium pilosum]|uniref:Uncharacterized protein n=1 Tax=Symbiodinium pilosum TaxID=2952 RepID=A0A812K7Q6_SYMPI|nr:unnamed protein product [Symbiodinium pilosum]
MNVSIPGKYGFRRKAEQRSSAVAAVWAQVSGLVDAEAHQPRAATGRCWETLPQVPPGSFRICGMM